VSVKKSDQIEFIIADSSILFGSPSNILYVSFL